MKRKVSKFKKHNFWNIDNSEAATTYSIEKKPVSKILQYPQQNTRAGVFPQ